MKYKVGDRVWVDGDDSVGMLGYEGVISCVSGNTLIVTDLEGEEEEVDVSRVEVLHWREYKV